MLMISFDTPDYIVLDGFRPGDELPSRNVRQEMADTLLALGYTVVLGVCCEADQNPLDALASALPRRPDLGWGIIGPHCVGNTPHGAALWQKLQSEAI